MARRLLVEIVGDEKSYLRAAQNTITTNTKLNSSFKQVGVNANLSADAQIKAAVKAQEAMRANALALSSRAASLPTGSKEQLAAQALAVNAQAKLARSYGVTTVATGHLGTASKTAERDLNKMTRGVLSGSGILTRFSRSLAFASSGFIAFAVGAEVIKQSIGGAEDLEKAQRSLEVAIKHTGGSLGDLLPRYQGIAKGAAQFGVTQAAATSGLARATVLTGNAASAQRAYQEALVISKATGKDFNAVLIATSKGQEGITTSLRRYGILVDATSTGQQQFNVVMRRFGGQAAANTTAAEKLSATFSNTLAAIGQELLPTFNHLATSLSAWLQKMNETGKLQKDVNAVIHDAGAVFGTLGDVIKAVDSVTGGFVHTLELLVAFKFAKVVTGWATSLELLIAKWRGVTVAAGEAAGAEAAAGRVGIVSGAGAAAGGARTATRVGAFAAAATSPGAIAAAAAIIALGFFSRNKTPFTKLGTTTAGDQSTGSQFSVVRNDQNHKAYIVSPRGLVPLTPGSVITVPGQPVITSQLQSFAQTRQVVPRAFQVPGISPTGRPPKATPGPFGTAKPMTQFFKTFQLNFAEQLAQAQAALTRSSADDVANARQIVARIKRLLDQGRLHGQALLQALGLEASALSTIWSAEQQAAQDRAAKAQAAKAKIEQQIQNAIDPLKLEVALSRAEAFGKPILPRLKALLRAAENGLRKAIAAHNLDLEKQALDQITSLKQQIKDAQTQPTVQFQLSGRLSLALARDSALGIDPTKDLLRAKAAILKFIRTHKHNIAALTDAYNQLAAINQQLGSSASSALGLFKQASTKALTAGLDLTAQQRKALRERLAGLGPGGTVSGTGVGAAGFAIDPNTGRPIMLDHRARRQQGRVGGVGERPIRVDNQIDLTVNIDGHHVEATVTKRQQKRNRRNPPQRRGPNAGR